MDSTSIAVKLVRVFFVWVLVAAADAVHGCAITILNNCSFPVTACSQRGPDPIIQYDLAAGGTQVLDFAPACVWQAGAIYASVTGMCAVESNPYAATDRIWANLAEFTIGGGDGLDYYDLSNVDAYTIGLQITTTGGTTPSNFTCGSPSCVINNLSALCQPNNVLQTYASGAQSCINTDGAAALGPTPGTEQFKSACPTSYSYNYDDPTSLFSCPTGPGTNYEVTFCP